MINLRSFAPRETLNAACEEDPAKFWLMGARGGEFLFAQHQPETLIMWLIGLYIAEGSKSVKAFEWSLHQKNKYTLAALRDCLFKLGVEQSRMKLCTIRDASVSYQEVVEHYKDLGLTFGNDTIQDPRRSNGREIHASFGGTLTITSSTHLKRLFVNIIQGLIDGGLLNQLSVDGLKALALGYLEGDGSVTDARTSIRVAITEDDKAYQKIIDHCMQRVWGWKPGIAAKDDARRDGIIWYIASEPAVELALSGAFRFSLARGRLILLATKFANQSPRLSELKPEIRLLKPALINKGLPPDAVAKKKGVSYPLLEDPSYNSLVPFIVELV